MLTSTLFWESSSDEERIEKDYKFAMWRMSQELEEMNKLKGKVFIKYNKKTKTLELRKAKATDKRDVYHVYNAQSTMDRIKRFLTEYKQNDNVCVYRVSDENIARQALMQMMIRRC